MESTINGRKSHRTLDIARCCGIGLFAVASLAAGFVVGEAALITPVIFLAAWLGFVPGLVVFTASCVIFGLAVLAAVVRFWPDRIEDPSMAAPSHGPVRRAVERAGRRSRPIGALTVAWYCGPFASPPIFRALGYQGRRLAIWVVVSGLLFGAFWFSFYGGAFSVVRRALT
jgi:hypothetical protein